jgi:hypothetical protein
MDLNDHDLLVAIHRDIQHLNHAVNGNGRPGLVQKVAALEADLTRRGDQTDELAMHVGSKRRRQTIDSAAITALLISLFAALKAVFSPT